MVSLSKNLDELRIELAQEEKQVNGLILDSWQNIHSNFTFDLVQNWQRHNFTYEQTRDWVNIYSLADQQGQAIQEPEFYAWLRDNENLTPEQVLNYGNISVLKQEFQQCQQAQQFQVKIVNLDRGRNW